MESTGVRAWLRPTVAGVCVMVLWACDGGAPPERAHGRAVAKEQANPVTPKAPEPARDEALPSPQPSREAEAAAIEASTRDLRMRRAAGLSVSSSSPRKAKRGSGYGDIDSDMNDPLAGLGEVRGTSTGYGYGMGGAAGREAPPRVSVGQGRFAVAPTDFNREGYEHSAETDFQPVKEHPLSTFSVDVDTASYTNVRRMLTQGYLPSADAVRVEEMINYFNYGYAQPTGETPFAIHTELTDCPWAPKHQLLRVGIQGRSTSSDNLPARNLTFLVDVSGSMSSADKLPLLRSGLMMLANTLREQDRVAIVVYAGAAGAVLSPTSGANRGKILSALEMLQSGGSTNGAQGIELAYQYAQANFIKGGINRVILATDGDFNVGVTSQGDLVRLIEEKRKSGVFLTVLGFGTGNLQDHTMESLADNGNGNYAYIDSMQEAERVLVREAGSTLVTIAKDVKLQLEFNPRLVGSYRLVGYENRRLTDQEFNDDRKDAGDVGAGHNVTALYEITPPGDQGTGAPPIDPLKYQTNRDGASAANTDELVTVKVRYKRPTSDRSELVSQVVHTVDAVRRAEASESTRFAAAVAMFGMVLRDSKFRGTATLADARILASGALGRDAHGDRGEFLALMTQASNLGAGRQRD